MLRDAASNWVRSHLSGSRFHATVERQLEEATALGYNYYLVMGTDSTRDGKPYLMHCYCGELFVFELTFKQARRFKIPRGQFLWGTGALAGRLESPETPAVAITGLAIERADGLPRGSPISADVSYEADGGWPDSCAFRLDYDVAGVGSVASFHYPRPPAERRGCIRCSFPPLHENVGKEPITSSIALFLRLYREQPNAPVAVQPMSNIRGALISLCDAGLG